MGKNRNTNGTEFKSLLPFLLLMYFLIGLSMATQAQFTGGIGRGETVTEAFEQLGSGTDTTTPTFTIYYGGIGRGDYFVSHGFILGDGLPLGPILPGEPYLGGIGRGDHFDTASVNFADFVDPLIPFVYKGGVGRGDHFSRWSNFGSNELYSIVYRGGIGRGDHQITLRGITTSLDFLPLYAGGIGRGDHYGRFSNIGSREEFPLVYRGGIGRGDHYSFFSNIGFNEEYPLVYRGGIGRGDAYAERLWNYFETNGNWYNASNWRLNYVPGPGETAHVLAHATLDADVDIGTLLLYNSGRVDIPAGRTMQISERARNFTYRPATFQVQASIDPITLPGGHGHYIGPEIDSAQVQIGVMHQGWHNSSVPIRNITLEDFAADNQAAGSINLTGDSLTQNLWNYNADLSGGQQIGFRIGAYSSHAWGLWELTPATQASEGNSYHIYYDHWFGGTPQIVVAEGRTSAQSYSKTIYPNWGGWNMIPNPYPCAMDLQTFYSDNSAVIEPGIFIWSPATARYAAIDASTGLTIHPDLTSMASGANAAMGQAFYIRPLNYQNDSTPTVGVAGTGTPSTITINPTVRTNVDTRFFKRQLKFLRLNVRETGVSGRDQCIIVSEANFQHGYQRGEDIPKYFDVNDTVPNVFVALDSSHAASIGKYGHFKKTDTVDLGLVGNRATVLQFELAEDHLGMKHYLLDRAEEEVWDLSVLPYNFYYNPATDLKRFAIIFDQSTNPVDLAEPGPLEVYSYSQEKAITTRFRQGNPWPNAHIYLFDLTGRVLQRAEISGGIEKQVFKHLNTGFYLIEIRSRDQKVYTEKVIIP